MKCTIAVPFVISLIPYRIVSTFIMNYWRQKFKKLFDQEEDANTYPKMVNMHRRIDNLCTIIGCNMLRENYKADFRTFLTTFLIVATLICFMHTQYFYFMRGKYLDLFLVFAYYGIIIQSAAKLYYSYVNKELLFEMGQRLLQIHAKYQVDAERRKILNVCYKRCEMIYKVFGFLYVNAIVVLMSFPLLIYIFDNKKVTMFVSIVISYRNELFTKDPILTVQIELLLIGFTSDSTLCYVVNMSYQFVVMCYAVMGLMAVDIMFM